jgi:hypothetical protein
MIYELLKRWQTDSSSVTQEEVTEAYEQRYSLLTPSRRDQCLFGAISSLKHSMSSDVTTLIERYEENPWRD